MRAVLAWLTSAGLADSILGDLEEGRRARGALWFWHALAGVIGYVAWTRVTALASGRGLRGFTGDVRHAVRVLRRRPGFTICVVLLLALGIGANTAVFSVVRAVLLRPLPYSEPKRLAFVWGELETRPGNRHTILTGQEAIEFKNSATTIESFALIKLWESGLESRADLIGPQGAERLRGAAVTPNFFELLGVQAATGRTFASADTEAPLAVISDALWRRRFGADPRIAGQAMPLSVGRPRTTAAYTIVGVLAPDFRFSYPLETEVYLLSPWRLVRPIPAFEYQMVARLKPGVTAGQAQAELLPVARNIVRSYFSGRALDEQLKRAGMLVEPVTEHLQAEVRPGVLLLAAVAGLVLVIACVNLGLLLLSGTVDRRGELGLRAALGASRRRIVSQLAAECLLLSIAGATVGVVTAALAEPVVRSLMPPVVPRADQIRVDSMVLAFAAGLMVTTALVSCLAPALFVIRRDLLNAVRGTANSATGDRAILASRRLIVTAQIAVVVLLLVGSGLLLRSFWRLQNVDLGFRADDVVTMEMRLLNPKYRTEGRIAAFHDEVLTRVRAVPGVARAGLTTAVPMRGVDFTYMVGPKGQKLKPGNMRSVDPDYFRVMNLRLKAGRFFTDADTATSEPVTIVSESYGRQYFGAANPVDGALHIDDHEVRIVGVVGDVRYADAARAPAPALYRPQTQEPTELICLVVEPQPGTRAAVMAGIRAAVQALDPEQPVEGITTIDEILSQSTADRRFYAVSTGAFASVAVLLAIAGVFGVVSRTVSERKRELAIRVALGAEPRRLLRLIYGYGLLPAAAGTAAGLGMAYAGSRVLGGFLFEIAPTDAATFLAAAVLIFGVTALACYLPARRMLRVPPMVVLKSE